MISIDGDDVDIDFKQLVEHIGDAVYVMAPDGELLFVNPEMASEVGYTQEEMIGKSAGEHLTEESIERGTENIRYLLRNQDETFSTYEMVVEHKKGERFYAEDKQRIVLEDGELKCIIGSIRNIEQRKQREKRIELKNEQLSRASKILNHDLRSPLNVILAQLEIQAQEYDETPKWLEDCLHSLKRVDEMLDKVIGLTRGGESLDLQEVEIAEVARDGFNSVIPHGNNAELEIDESAVNRTIEADKSRFQQLLENLFKNSYEHNDVKDGVTITVGCLDGDGFYVEDDGVGFDTDIEFKKVEYTDYSGLGLTIIREVADQHEWDIEMASSEDGGARFNFYTN